MKHLDEYRDPAVCAALIERIRSTATRRWTVMEVCGGQTHGLLRDGIDRALEGQVELLHGPGCPVCVTPVETIDRAIELAFQPGVLLASFGDMLRVPGSRGSLLRARTDGAEVRPVYSPLDAVQLAQRSPRHQVVFLAVGFETTAPATAVAVQQADRLGLENFSLLVSHVRVLPAMRQLLADPECRIQAFLAAGHVCTVTGSACYRELVERRGVPVVVTGFEPVDLLWGILECVTQLEAGRAELANRYARSAADQGNRRAQEILSEVYEVADSPWRGIGMVPGGGLALRGPWRKYDAARRFAIPWQPAAAEQVCRGGDVLTGRIKPTECEHFGTLCTPDTPLGAPMVSAEGACAAYHRYHGSHRDR